MLAFKNDYFVTYSVTTVELELTLVNRSGSVLWNARHAASSHEGAMPLSPLFLSGIFTATTNQQDEVGFQMVDAAARRLLKTLPDRPEQNSAEDAIGNIIDTTVLDQKGAGEALASVEEKESAMQLLAQGAYEQALLAAQADIEADGLMVRPTSLRRGPRYCSPTLPPQLITACQLSLTAKQLPQHIPVWVWPTSKMKIGVWPMLLFGRQLNWTQQALKCNSIWLWFQK